METTTDLHIILSRELDTTDLNLEHDTVVASPDFSRRVVDALRSLRDDPATSFSPPASG